MSLNSELLFSLDIVYCCNNSLNNQASNKNTKSTKNNIFTTKYHFTVSSMENLKMIKRISKNMEIKSD
jgi:hypothetical protein